MIKVVITLHQMKSVTLATIEYIPNWVSDENHIYPNLKINFKLTVFPNANLTDYHQYLT